MAIKQLTQQIKNMMMMMMMMLMMMMMMMDTND